GLRVGRGPAATAGGLQGYAGAGEKGGRTGTASYVDLFGMPSRAQLIEHYAQVSGRQVDDMDYYDVLAQWKLAIVLEQGFQRAGDNEKLRAFGPMVLDLMKSAADLAETTAYGT
ncbi:hypothetical protein ABZ372_39255, partial [Streptomyces sp. NPDC005921]